LPYPDVPLPIGPIGPIGFLEAPEPVSPVAEVHELGPFGTQIREGQVYTGRVVQTGGGRALLRFGAQQFEVPIREPLQAGDHVTARAVAVDGRVVLHIRPQQQQRTTAQSEDREAIAAQLRSLGIEPTDAAMLAARTMRTLGLGLRPQLLEMLARLLTQNGAMTGELAALAQSLDRYAARPGASERDGLLDLICRLEKMLLAADDPELAEKIGRFVRQSGVFTEARLRQAAEQGKAPDDLLADDLKWALLKLRTRLMASLSQTDEAGRTALAQIQRTLAMIEAHQIEDVYGQRAGYFVIELPFREGTGFEGARVRFFYRRGRAGEPPVDANNCTALIEVTMSRLGPIRALVTVVRGSLSCQIMSARPDVVELLETEVESLHTTLESLPFHIAEVACIVIDTEEGDEPGGSPEPGHTATWPAGLDLNA